MLNHIVIMGRLVRDPEMRYTQNQVPVTSFRVAVDRDYTSRDNGDRQTDFIDCVAWRNTGEFVNKYFTKGSMIIVSGRLQIREWTDRDNNKRYTAEIVAENVHFGETKRSREEYQSGGNAGNYNGNYGSSSGSYGNSGNAGNYGGGNAGNYSGGGNNYQSFDNMSGESAFSDLSDSDGDLPF